MAFKVNLAHNGRVFKMEVENEELTNHSIGDFVDGKVFGPELEGYEVEITGTSDKAGFCGLKTIEGPRLHRKLLSYETGMHSRPKKEGKKKRSNRTPKGLRLRKTVRGREISLNTSLINTKVRTEGNRKFDDLLNSSGSEQSS